MNTYSEKKSNKRILIVAFSFLILCVLGFIAYTLLPKLVFKDPGPATDLIEQKVIVPPAELVMPHKKQAESPTEIEMMVNELAQGLKSEFSETIHLIATQVGLKNLRDDLDRSYPDHGTELLIRILTQAFPEWVDAILKSIALMDAYNTWLESMLLSLNDMNQLEQQGVLWEKRRELFGDAATQIWQEEISAEQERQLTMQRTMDILDRSYDTQMEERLYILQSTFEESYADKLQNMVIDPKGVLSQVFFGFDAVQRDLDALAPEERQAQINQIRKSMGFKDEQIAHLAEADQKREKRWQNGYAYMDARKAAEAEFTGDQLAAELDKVREKFFAHEANTIKKEEEELAFFRYTRPRIYGRN